MFKYSVKWLEKLLNKKIDYNDFNKNWLDLQGFEVAGARPFNDDIIVELEVKANRPDMLSHLGVLREYYCYNKIKELPQIKSSLIMPNKSLGIDVNVTTEDVDKLVLVSVNNIDNSVATPKSIVELLESFGVKSINPAVDISNFILLEVGQPIHIFDADKIKNGLVYKNLETNKKFRTLNGENEIEVPKGTIVINDGENITCLAGLIGSKEYEVDENTKNIIIESAHFDAIKLRIASQKTFVSTLASYRFERGVDSTNVEEYALLCAENIMNICGGTLDGRFIKTTEEKLQKIKTSKTKVNKLLGTNFSQQEIQNLLESYYYKVEKIDEDNIYAYPPKYRLDVELEVDVIGDIAQIYGYHNISPNLPNLAVEYEPNLNVINTDKVRDILISQNLNECITYGFIHKDSMKKLNVSKESALYGDIEIINPLSINFAVMRPNLMYSLLTTLTYNLAINNECEPIFEIGSVYKRDDKTDTGYNQNTNVAVLLNGNKFTKGFGLDKNIQYDFYDIKQIFELIATEYNFKYEFKPSNEQFFEKSKGLEIYINNEYAGILGTINSNLLKNIENGKLVKGEVQYLEFDLAKLVKHKTLMEQQSKYPSIEREYNLLVPNGALYSEYSQIIKNVSKEVRKIEVLDIYKGKNVAEGHVSVLIKVEYFSTEFTLTGNYIAELEETFLEDLKDKFSITLKV